MKRWLLFAAGVATFAFAVYAYQGFVEVMTDCEDPYGQAGVTRPLGGA